MSKAKGWTEAEKLGLLFQIIEKAGTIPWDELTLPEGRTKKACAVMVDKEKAKVRKARGADANGEEGEEGSGDGEPKAKAANKRKEGNEEATTPKKPKTTRKKKETIKAGSDEEAAQDGEGITVKPEPEEEDVF